METVITQQRFAMNAPEAIDEELVGDALSDNLPPIRNRTHANNTHLPGGSSPTKGARISAMSDGKLMLTLGKLNHGLLPLYMSLLIY